MDSQPSVLNYVCTHQRRYALRSRSERLKHFYLFDLSDLSYIYIYAFILHAIYTGTTIIFIQYTVNNFPDKLFHYVVTDEDHISYIFERLYARSDQARLLLLELNNPRAFRFTSSLTPAFVVPLDAITLRLLNQRFSHSAIYIHQSE